MRTFCTVIVVVATGFLAYVFRDELQKHRTLATVPSPAVSAVAPTPAVDPAPAAETAEAEPAPEFVPDSPATEIALVPPASRVPQIRTAPPGSYFLTARVSVTTDSGVFAVLPGEEVKLLYRNKNGTARVKWNSQELTVREAQLAREIDLATKKPPVQPSQLLGQRST